MRSVVPLFLNKRRCDESSERCCKRVWCYSHDIRAIRQQIRATSDTICRPVYATTQIFIDEEERTLSDYLLCATKLHYGLSWKTTRPIQKNMSTLILTYYINVENRGTNVKLATSLFGLRYLRNLT